MSLYGLKALVMMYGELHEKYSFQVFHTEKAALDYREEFVKALNDGNLYDHAVEYRNLKVTEFFLVSQ